MKVDRVKDLIDCLSKMGYNLLELCIDDMYKIEDEPYFGYLRGGYTKAEIQEMDAYARSKGIELVPAIQTLGHFSNLVKIPHYADIVDIDNILLVDEPKTYELIEKMFATIAQAFTSRKVNIGFDEAHRIGLGKYLDKHGYTNRYELLIRHLKKVVAIAEKCGFKIHMWSDMFFKLFNGGEYWKKGVRLPKEICRSVPKEVGVCYWDYYGTDEEMYDEMLQAHEDFDRELWFAGGAWTWNGFAPHNRFSLEAMLPAMKQVRRHGVQNVLITMWGDDGHDCSYFSVLPALYAIKQYAEGNFDETRIKQGFYELFGVAFDDFMQLDIPNCNKSNPEMRKTDNACKVLLYNDCFLGLKDKAFEPLAPVPFAKYADVLTETGKRMKEYAYLYDNLAALCRVLEIKSTLGLRTRKAYKANDKAALRALLDDYRETIERLRVFRNTLRTVWMKDNKPYGWDIQEMRLGGLSARLNDCIQRLTEYLSGEAANIPELEEELLPYSPWGSQYNLYCGFVTVSQL